MGLTAAEKQRRYRQKRNEDGRRRLEYLAKEKEWYKNKKEKGQVKLVADLSFRERRKQRKKWKLSKCEYRKRQTIQILSPPASPEPQQDDHPTTTRQYVQSKKKKKREKAKCYRDNEILRKKLDNAFRKQEMYRKRLQRLSAQNANVTNTPRSKTKQLLRLFNLNKGNEVRRTLIFHNALIDQLKESYKNGNRKSINKILAGNILKKYKFKVKARNAIGVHSHQGCRKKQHSLSKRLENEVLAFFERDDVSTLTTGLKRTLTKKKVKRQKRLLQDTLHNLFKKFLEESKINVSFTTFWRLKPFWVTYPTTQDRDTCLCKTCENTKILAFVLFKEGVVKSHNLEQLVKDCVCSIENKNCMYGDCDICRQKPIFEGNQEQDRKENVKWRQWKTKKEERILKSGEKKQITLTIKDEESGNMEDLQRKFHAMMWNTYRKHHFNIKTQFKHYQKIQASLESTQCLIHVDFAENYVGKMANEIQSMHFVASQPQISLHTGYYMIERIGKPVSFCGVSDSLQHDPASIWAFMKPVFAEIRTNDPAVDYIHFFSDGPTTQYRQKNNFYMLSTEIYHFGFKGAS